MANVGNFCKNDCMVLHNKLSLHPFCPKTKKGHIFHLSKRNDRPL